MRRLVTGIDADGKSVFVHDGPAPEVTAGAGFELGALWSGDAATRLGDATADAARGRTGTVPPPGATVFTYVVIPPEDDAVNHGATSPRAPPRPTSTSRRTGACTAPTPSTTACC